MAAVMGKVWWVTKTPDGYGAACPETTGGPELWAEEPKYGPYETARVRLLEVDDDGVAFARCECGAQIPVATVCDTCGQQALDASFAGQTVISEPKCGKLLVTAEEKSGEYLKGLHEALDAEFARQEEFGMEPSLEDIRIAFQIMAGEME